jgi:hypothetical protein
VIDELSFTLFPTSGRVYVWRTLNEAYNPECLVPTAKHGGRFCDGLGRNIVVQSSLGPIPIVTLHGRITAREHVDRLGNQVHSMIQTLYPNNGAVFHDDNSHSWNYSEEHEGELKHLPWPAESPDLNIVEPLWSVLETRVRNKFPPPTSLKQLEDVLQEERYKIPPWTVQNLYRVHSKDCGSIEGKRWSNTVLIKTCVQLL